MVKTCTHFVSLVLGCYSRDSIFHFKYQKSPGIFREPVCRPLSGVGEIDFSPIFIKYTKILHLTLIVCKNLLFNIPFCMHNKLKMIIKIFSSMYLLLAVLFPSNPLYWHNESWVHKTRKYFYDTAKTGSTPNHRSSKTIIYFRSIFNFTKFYTSGLKVLSPHWGSENPSGVQ